MCAGLGPLSPNDRVDRLATANFQLGMFDDANAHLRRLVATTKDPGRAAKAQKLMDTVYA